MLILALGVAPDGSVTVGGVFDGAHDLMPGPAEHRVTADGYRTFVTQLDARGVPRWAWASLDHEQRLAALIPRGTEVLVVESGQMTRIDAYGTVIETARFSVPMRDGVGEYPDIHVSGAVLDPAGRVNLVATLPDAYPEVSLHLFGDRPYLGPRGPVLATPIW